MDLWKRLSRYTQGVILIMVSFLFFAWGVLGAAQVDRQTRDIAELVEAQHMAAAKNQDELLHIVIDNGEFQTCVWHSIVKPKNVGNQKRSVRAIRQCERRFLNTQEVNT